MAQQKRSTAKKPTGRTTGKPAAKPQPKRQGAAKPRGGSKPAASRRQARRSSPAAPARHPALAKVPGDLIEQFGRERVELLVGDATGLVPRDASALDLTRLLSEAKRLSADPLRGDVYLARGKARDGAEYAYEVAVRRDALLRYAEAHDDFAGFQANAVYAGDTFKVGRPDTEAKPEDLAGRAGIFHEAVYGKDRGKVERAWCVVERASRPLIWFVAERSEFIPDDIFEGLDADDPWKRYTDRCLVKAAMCWPLRMAYKLNDVVGAEELGARLVPASPRPAAEPVDVMPNLDGTDDLDARVIALYTEARRIDPAAWPPAKLRARLLGDPDREQREELARELSDRVAERLDELIAFDPATLEGEELGEFQAERARLEALLEQPAAVPAAA